MTHPIVERRRAEQKEKVALADGYIRGVELRLDIKRAWVVGSVARGDFNVWSDIDVLVVARGLPSGLLARADLFSDKPPSIQIVAYTPDEFESEAAKGNRLVVESQTAGVPIGSTGGPPRTESSDS